MPEGKPTKSVRQSILDRLIDLNPKTTKDPPLTWAESVAGLKASVLRDIEWLLNTRRLCLSDEEVPEGLRHSLYNYGLTDITSLSAEAPDTSARLVRNMQEAIELFEPRLSGVKVVLVPSEEPGRQRLHFVIEGMLEMDPSPEKVVFDSVLEIMNGSIVVTGAGDA